MKGTTSTLLALLFVFYALLTLVSKNHSWDNALVRWDESQPKVSDLGLRYRMEARR